MNEVHRENLSALADGELAFDQVRFMLRRTENDATLRMTWSSYHVGRDCLRGEFSGLAGADFADRVMTALDAGQTASAGARRWLRWSAGGAIAASVAAVALMVAQPAGTGEGTSPVARSAVNAPTPTRAVASTPRASAPEVPRWLSPAAPAAQLTQPASASVMDGQIRGDTLIPAAYSRHMAPYMSLHGYSSRQINPAQRYGRTADGRWIIPMMPPASADAARSAGNRR